VDEKLQSEKDNKGVKERKAQKEFPRLGKQFSRQVRLRGSYIEKGTRVRKVKKEAETGKKLHLGENQS